MPGFIRGENAFFESGGVYKRVKIEPLVGNGIKPKTDDKSNGLRKPALIFFEHFQLCMIFQLTLNKKQGFVNSSNLGGS